MIKTFVLIRNPKPNTNLYANWVYFFVITFFEQGNFVIIIAP